MPSTSLRRATTAIESSSGRASRPSHFRGRSLLPADQDRSPLNLFFHNRRAQETLGGADMPRHWVRSLRNELELFNPLVGLFNMLMTEADGVTPATLEIQQQGPAAELAGILHYGASSRKDRRSIYVNKRTDQGPTRISTDHALYDALCYPLLFPHGTASPNSRQVTLRDVARLRLLMEPRFQTFWKVGNMYMIDIVCRLEENRLDFICRSLANLHRGSRVQPASHEIEELDVQQEGHATSGFIPRSPAPSSALARTGQSRYRTHSLSLLAFSALRAWSP
ncbi:unnamed protein product [Tilletia caries]|uniref:Uncharacterized protein n=1 Tax=Tilletia caries TaxID=13290 RepID=A0ABN7J2W6_9BASI|nr:unnamed protein product [Tilletia caries]